MTNTTQENEMKTGTVESYVLHKGQTRLNASISYEEKDSIFSHGKAGYHPWFGGAGIGMNQPTIEEARAICFGFLVIRLEDKIKETEKELRELKSIQEKLGNDIFNLGKFKV